VDLKHSVDAAYRSNAEFMMNDLTVAAISKLLDGNGKPLWAAGIQVGAPDTILNHPYVVNNDMAVMAASAKSILFGDFSKYMIRDVLGITMMRLAERYADFLQVGFMAFMRTDADLLDAGQAPIKHYINAAS
jgi:HK97 family phage major capsid protein